jgi:hypothetical protein
VVGETLEVDRAGYRDVLEMGFLVNHGNAIDPQVGKVRNDTPELIEPVKEDQENMPLF